jgi:hypothetical protein
MENNMASSKLLLDPAGFVGALLTDVSRSLVYENNQATDRSDGFKYRVALPSAGYLTVPVKVNHAQPLFEPGAEIEPGTVVEFTKLRAHPYVYKGQLGVTATAEDVRLSAARRGVPDAPAKSA